MSLIIYCSLKKKNFFFLDVELLWPKPFQRQTNSSNKNHVTNSLYCVDISIFQRSQLSRTNHVVLTSRKLWLKKSIQQAKNCVYGFTYNYMMDIMFGTIFYQNFFLYFYFSGIQFRNFLFFFCFFFFKSSFFFFFVLCFFIFKFNKHWKLFQIHF
jgi:hypothetical protein